MSNYRKVYRVITIITLVITLCSLIYIITHRLGLVDRYDFGAGAYYYTDIPNYQEVIPDNIYHSTIPLSVYILLFLSWGWLMWRLWCWIDKSEPFEEK